MANIRVTQAADYCGVSTSFLNHARCKGGGPAYVKLGSAVIYSTDDLDAWLESRRVAAANENTERKEVA